VLGGVLISTFGTAVLLDRKSVVRSRLIVADDGRVRRSGLWSRWSPKNFRGTFANTRACECVEAGGRSVWTPRDTPEPGLWSPFVADPDGNLVELLSSDEEAPPT
jgi:hypothetical protein